MRVVLICVFMLLLGIQVARSDDAEALPQKINIAFTAEDGATFTLKGVNVTGLTVQLAQTTYTVPADDCAKLHDVDFRTVRLLWDVESKRAVDGEYSALRFTMGTDSDRSFGELPTVHVHLDRGGKYLSTVITRKTGPTGYRDGDRRKGPNQSLQPTALWRCASISILISVFSTVAQPRCRSGG